MVVFYIFPFFVRDIPEQEFFPVFKQIVFIASFIVIVVSEDPQPDIIQCFVQILYDMERIGADQSLALKIKRTLIYTRRSQSA